MPSDTFLRLNDEKKKKLMDASFKEFSLYNFNDASINRIIKEAGIPRGSFYMYFVDKKDLYFYLLEQYLEVLINNMKNDLIKNKGDLFKMFQNNIKEEFNSFKNNNINFFKKSLENVTIMEESKKTFGFRDKRLLRELIPNINLELLNDNAKKHIEVIFAINMHLLMVTLMKLLKSDSLDEEILKDYYEQLDILKYGCVKKEDLC